MPDLLERLSSALGERYAVESEIGRGGMATVFLAEDLRHHRQVAIKVLHPELSVTLAADRFLNEIQIVAGLNHPHILMLIDSGVADGLLYYIMPYVRGESLRDRLERDVQLPVEEAVRIAVEVADGLDFAHREGVIHRDVKPGNILLSDKHAVITDFGIARAISVSQGERVTSTGLGVGTPLYASPEQATGAETLDGRTDTYSLGCVLYEMLAGQVPLTASTPQGTQARRISETPAPIRAMRDTVPPLLDEVIARALARLPADRWGTAEQFGQALMTATMDAAPVAKLELATTPRLNALAKRGRRMPPVWLVAPFVLVAAIAILMNWQSQTDERDSAPTHAAANDANEVQLTSVGDVRGVDISPDGQQVAYCSGSDAFSLPPGSGARIMLVRTGDPEAERELAFIDDCMWIRWLPDGSGVVFRGSVKGRRGSFFVSQYGGPTRQVSCGDEIRPPEFSPDGSRCVYTSRQLDAAILIASLDDSLPEDTVFIEGEYHDIAAVDWLPSAERLAVETVDGSGAGTVWTVDLDGGDRISVITIDGPFDWQWSQDGSALYYAVGAGDKYDLLRLPASPDGSPDGEPEWLMQDGPLRHSGDGRQGVATRRSVRSRIVRIAIDPEAGPPASSVKPVVGWTEGDFAGFVSHNGDWVSYGSDDGSFRVSVDGGAPLKIGTHRGGSLWSPDDRFLVYRDKWADTTRLWVAAADGGAPLMVNGYPRVVDGRIEDGYPVAWYPSGLVVNIFGHNTNVRVLDSLQAWNRERRTWMPLQDAGYIVADSGVRTAGRWLVQNDSAGTLMGLAGPWAISPGGDRLLVAWRRTADGSRWTDSTFAALASWVISIDGLEQTPVPHIGLRVLGWTETGVYTLSTQPEQPSTLQVQAPDGDPIGPLLEVPRSLGLCQIRPGVDPVELICTEREESIDAWLIENFDPHVN